MHIYKKFKETLHACLRGRIAALRGTRNLAVHRVLSRFLRSVRLALHPARRLIPRFLKQFLCFFMCALVVQTAYAANTSLTIRTAELVAVDDGYVLNADVDMKFSTKVEEAISKGFILNFLLEFQLAKPRKYWFDDEIATVVHALALSYHALSRQFLVTRGDQQKAFVRLDEALDDLSDISGLKVLKKSDIDLDEPYKAALLMRLDTKKLPQALQGVANDGDWGMRSQRFEWVPNFNQHPAKTEIKLDLAK